MTPLEFNRVIKGIKWRQLIRDKILQDYKKSQKGSAKNPECRNEIIREVEWLE